MLIAVCGAAPGRRRAGPQPAPTLHGGPVHRPGNRLAVLSWAGPGRAAARGSTASTAIRDRGCKAVHPRRSGRGAGSARRRDRWRGSAL